MVAAQSGLSRRDVSLVSELLFRELHKRQYETEASDYLCGELLFDLSDYAWIHLYQFLLLRQMRSGNTNVPDEDLVTDSVVQLQYLGGKSEWKKYVFEMSHWKMSSQYGREKGLYE